MTDWKPANYPSMSPYLVCKEPEALISFIADAFGGELLRKFDRPDGSLMHAEVRIDDSVLMIGGATDDFPPMPQHLHLYVPDALAVYERAVSLGATVIQEPGRKSVEDDDMRGGIKDASGTTWWIVTGS